jgi:hypothetical protein
MSIIAPVRFTLRVTNRLEGVRTVVLEPWTGEYRVRPGEQLDIVVEGTPVTPLEIELNGDRLVLATFDSADAMLTAYRDGRELRSEFAPPAG